MKRTPRAWRSAAYLLGDAVRRRQDHDVAVFADRGRVHAVSGEVAATGEMGIEVVQAAASFAASDRRDDLPVGVAEHEFDHAEALAPWHRRSARGACALRPT